MICDLGVILPILDDEKIFKITRDMLEVNVYV